MAIERAERDMWRLYRDGDRAAREELARQYLPAAIGTAHAYMRRYPGDRDAIYSAALLGLSQAMSRFDPESGNTFLTLLLPTMRGRILDEARSSDHLSRNHRLAATRAAGAAEQLGHHLGRHPNGEDLRQVGAECPRVREFVSMSRPVRRDGREGCLGDFIAAPAIRATEEDGRRFEDLGLAERDRQLLISRFVLGRTFEEIAKERGQSKSLASQRCQELIRLLRGRGKQTKEALLA